jgi:DNA-binding beta-propeller fold protein YncE
MERVSTEAGFTARRSLIAVLGVGIAIAVALSPSNAPAAIVKVKTFGAGAPGPGHISGAAEGIATDDEDHVYVADTGKFRIAEFSPRGLFIDAWGNTGPRDEQVSAPFDLDFDSAGNAYVSDPGLSAVFAYDQGGEFLRRWGRPGTGNGEFGYDESQSSPYGIAVGEHDHVYASDFVNVRAQEFTSAGHFLHKWEVIYPRNMATDADGNLYVGEYFSARVVKYSPTGRFLLTFGWGVRNGDARPQVCRAPKSQCQPGIPGRLPGQFTTPEGIATDPAGNVYVADNGIEKFSADGRYLTTIRQYTEDVAIDSNDNVYALVCCSEIVKYAQVSPQTRITRSRIHGHRARFRFRSSEPDSSFKCRLDRRPFRRCEPPKAYRHLRPGRHRFRVKAIDSDKLVDPTLAHKSFRVSR